MKTPLKFLPLLFVLVLLHPASAAETLKITDFGAKPNSRENTTVAVRKAIDKCRQLGGATLVFPKGEYHFWPDPETKIPVGFWMHDLKDVTVEGNGSMLIFHEIMGIASVRQCTNVTFRDLQVDWEKPVLVQGEIVNVAETHLDVKFDTKEYPFEIEGEKIVFPGENWRRGPDGYNLLFNPKTKELLPHTQDHTLGHGIFNAKAEKLGKDRVRFHQAPKFKPPRGTIVAIWIGRYIRPGFDISGSKDVVLRNVTLYHALSHGVVASRTENLTLDKVDYLTNDKKGRVFTMVADGYHINACKGLVKIENCTQVGMGDDFLNIHGMNVMITKRVDDRTIETGTGKQGAVYTLGVGDEVWFVNGKTSQRGETAVIESIEPVREGDKVVTHRIRFKEPIPASLVNGDSIENKTYTAELEMRGCNILKRHRARGILISTPRRAVVENNLFRTAGTAILIEGDTNFWFESGGVTDLVIRNNVFEDCFTAGGWGQAVITVTPSFKPQNENDEAYHRNIRIENNEFRHFDPALLYVRSVRDLVFRNNKIVRSRNYEPFTNRPMFCLDGCRNVLLEGNTYGPGVLGRNIETVHMKADDVTVKDQGIRVEIKENQ